MSETCESTSANFGFLAGYHARLLAAATAAERYVITDGVTSLMRTRQLTEFLSQALASRIGLPHIEREPQHELLGRLHEKGALTQQSIVVFHGIRKTGNKATHYAKGDELAALHHLRMAHQLAGVFHRAVGDDPAFKTPPFVPPAPDGVEDPDLVAELSRLQKVLEEATAGASSGGPLTYQLPPASDAAEQHLDADEVADADWRDHLNETYTATQQASEDEVQAFVRRVRDANDTLDLDEAATRQLIDAQLQDAGWVADTVAISYKQGVRPTKGKNLAIAEWPTSSGPADYVLFLGLKAIAVVEAKRKRKDVAGAIEQAKRYSKDYVIRGDERLPGGPWDEYKIPFLFATNGRPYLRQIRTKSGIWFLDARRSTNHPDALEGWYTPEGLKALVGQDHAAAEEALKAEPTDYLGLRHYQLEAIQAVDAGIADGRRQLLLAMATGTGKTRTALGLIYRFIKARRFRRILFLVDRKALGEQAENAFKNVKLERLQSLNEIYDVRGLEDVAPDEDTRLHVATIQGMVKRLLYSADPDDHVPVDRYDCIIVDESHRGYNLDREMSESELEYRSQDDYVSKYRRVLDHFHGVRIGLTATPALHTTEIFGAPIYQYTYRQAVIDGYLIDHEPPIRIRTTLNQESIHWAVGEPVAVYNQRAGQLEIFNTPDEIDIEVEGFNTKVITENFNRVVCQYLAREIDPRLPGKTMIFCATDAHADMVVDLLKEAFKETYGEVEDDAVMKITGAADKPLHKIRLYKNEALPKVAVTVDLLTTGIDVPEITNLVFIRRVKSRILYEQMLGRATRLCPEIGKEVFRVYDAVDLYAALQSHTSMTPVVTQPKLSFVQLAGELMTIDDDAHCEAVADDILVKFHRRRRRLHGESLSDFVSLSGMQPAEFIAMLKQRHLPELRDFFGGHDRLPPFLDKLKPTGGRGVLVSEHEDEFVGTERGYGSAERPEDYLEGFKAYLEHNGNRLPALLVVMQRPRDLTRQQLRELRLALDEAGYNVSSLRTAWAETTNQDIAASIIGFIRRQALGSPLVPYEERVDRAMRAILAKQACTPPQRKWLERIGSQLLQEIIVDKTALDRGEFKAQGGFNRLNKIFDGKLEDVLGDLHDELWRDVG